MKKKLVRGALHDAAKAGDNARVHKLLGRLQKKGGAALAESVEAEDEAGVTPLHLAAWGGSAQAVEALLAAGCVCAPGRVLVNLAAPYYPHPFIMGT